MGKWLRPATASERSLGLLAEDEIVEIVPALRGVDAAAAPEPDDSFRLAPRTTDLDSGRLRAPVG